MTTTARLTIINTAWISLVVWAWMQGYVQRIMEADGARIIPDSASGQGGIWILLAEGANEPVYYRLPYSKHQAEQLQMLMDLTGGEPGAISMTMGEGGEPSFEDGRPQTETKQAERPIYGGGNG